MPAAFPRPAAPAAPPIPSPLLTRAEAEAYLRISERKLRNITAPHGPLPRVKDGARVFYRRDSLDRYIADLESAPANRAR